MVLCGGFSAEVRAKKMRQDGCTEFISASLGRFMARRAADVYRNEPSADTIYSVLPANPGRPIMLCIASDASMDCAGTGGGLGR